ncbi:hypothetical protein [Ruegeria arenilitoris]|uniref:hypothetical protein n=1 Tax=Ruegeria arenilitoris TaxID=1173585 RepID=UPI001480F98D|nr:hypothetical protein [Ruegeria arenilitoris]
MAFDWSTTHRNRDRLVERIERLPYNDNPKRVDGWLRNRVDAPVRRALMSELYALTA